MHISKNNLMVIILDMKIFLSVKGFGGNKGEKFTLQ